MLASITPLGERGRGSTWGITVTAFAIGATGAGVLLGAACGGLGALAVPAALAPGARLGLAALACALACACDAARPAAPGPRRQVDERWLDRFRGWVYGLGFGAQLGAGVTTRVTSAATYAAIATALLTRSVEGGAVVLGLLGVLRGLTPLLAVGVRTPRDLMRLHSGLARWRGASRRSAVCALGALTLVAGIGALA